MKEFILDIETLPNYTLFLFTDFDGGEYPFEIWKKTNTCRTKMPKFVKSLGADHVIDHTQEDFTKGDVQYDVVYDTVEKSSYRKSKKVLTDNGVYMCPVLSCDVLIPMLGNKFRGKKAKFDATGLKPAKELNKMLRELTEIIPQMDYNFVIERRYAMEEIVEAHQRVDTGRKRGNLVLSI